jgi:hypothetical protein
MPPRSVVGFDVETVGPLEYCGLFLRKSIAYPSLRG